MQARKVRTVGRRKTTVWVDQRKLERARKILGTDGVRDTIEGALDEVLAVEARRKLVDRLRDMKGLDLDDPEIMAKAWR